MSRSVSKMSLISGSTFSNFGCWIGPESLSFSSLFPLFAGNGVAGAGDRPSCGLLCHCRVPVLSTSIAKIGYSIASKSERLITHYLNQNSYVCLCVCMYVCMYVCVYVCMSV